MHRIARCSSLAALVVILGCTSAWAQATASISGTVRDESSGVLPGATVTATQTETGLVRSTVSNETGSYSLPNLPLGPYRLEAMLSGFRSFAQTGIVLQVNSSPVVNPVLAVGEIAEQVQVTGTAQLVDTRSSGVGTVVESQRIVELPLNARQVTQLITLSGFAVQTAASPGYSMNTGVRISVAGGNDFGVSYSLDGAPHLNNFDGTGMHLPFPDALQEFRIVTGAQEAAGNIRAGASVNAVTKSGTNTLHGDLFEFVRDSRFNEPDFLSGRNDGLKRNQFGGTIGGPIAKDKVFFFIGLQTTTTRQTPLDQTAFVPTAAMLAGDFTAFASPACNNGRQLTLGAPFVSNRIDASLISPAALNISRRLPTPIDDCGKVFWGTPVHQNESQIPIRVDFQASQKHSFVVRYMLTTDDRTIPYEAADDNILVTNAPGSDDRAHNIAVGHTWVVNQAMVNSFRVLGNDVYANKPGPEFFSPQDVGINAYTYVPGYMRLIVANGFNVGAGSFTSNLYTKIQNGGASNDFTWLKGSHQLGLGGHYLWTKSDSVGQRVVGRQLHVHRPVHHQRDGRLLRGSRRPAPSGQRESGQGHAAHRRRLRPGRVEAEARHAQLRRGVESLPADELLRGGRLQLQPRRVQQGDPQHGHEERATRIQLSGRPWFRGKVGREEPLQRVGPASRHRLGPDGRRPYSFSGRRRHRPRLHLAAAALEHVVGVAVPVDGQSSTWRESRQPVGDLPGRQPLPVPLRSEQPGLPGLQLVPAAAVGSQAHDAGTRGTPASSVRSRRGGLRRPGTSVRRSSTRFRPRSRIRHSISDSALARCMTRPSPLIASIRSAPWRPTVTSGAP